MLNFFNVRVLRRWGIFTRTIPVIIDPSTALAHRRLNVLPGRELSLQVPGVNEIHAFHAGLAAVDQLHSLGRIHKNIGVHEYKRTRWITQTGK